MKYLIGQNSVGQVTKFWLGDEVGVRRKFLSDEKLCPKLMSHIFSFLCIFEISLLAEHFRPVILYTDFTYA